MHNHPVMRPNLTDAQGTVSEQRCRIRAVTPTPLTCTEVGGRAKLVFDRTAVAAVYRVDVGTSISVFKVLLAAGAGFLVGCAITDGNLNFQLGALGAVTGAGYGVRWAAGRSPPSSSWCTKNHRNRAPRRRRSAPNPRSRTLDARVTIQ